MKKRKKSVAFGQPAGPGSYICMPLRRNVPNGIENGVLVKCPECGAECWRSPLVDRLEQTGAVALCTNCALMKGVKKHG